MTFQELLFITRGGPIFKTSALLTGESSANGIRRQLDRWVKAGKIIMLRRSTYVIAAPYVAEQPHLFRVANALRNASYVSLQSALAYYGMIPEYTPVTTSVATGRPENLRNSQGQFLFRHVKKSMFYGFSEQEIMPRQSALIATPEKAMVDLLYLTPNSDKATYIEELRITPGAQLDLVQLTKMTEQSGSGKVRRAVSLLREFWESESEYISL